MMAVGFFGCCGAMRESQCVLGSVSGLYEGQGGLVNFPGGRREPRIEVLNPPGLEALALDPICDVCFLHLLHENSIIIFVPAHMENVKTMRPSV